MIRHWLIVIAALLLVGCTTGGTKMTSSWKQPEYRLAAGDRLVVLAQIDEPGSRRAMEDETAAMLRGYGVQAVPAYQALPQMAMVAPDLGPQAAAAGFKAVVLYASGHSYTDVANRPGLGTGVGIGPIGIGVGPLIGGSKAEQRTTINVQILPVGSAQPVWSAQYDVNLADGIRHGVADVPARSVEQMKVDRLW